MWTDDYLKKAWCWERLRAGGEGDNRGWDGWWHHWLNAHEFGSSLGVGDDRQAWCSAIHGVVKSQTRLSDWTELKKYKLSAKELSSYELSKMLTCSLSTWGMSGTAAFLLSPIPEDLSSLPSTLPLPSAVRSSSCLFTRFKTLHTSYCMVLLVAQTIKWVPTMQGTRVQSLGWEDLLEKEMTTNSSALAWKILWMEELGRLQSMGSQRLGHDWVISRSLSLFIVLCKVLYYKVKMFSFLVFVFMYYFVKSIINLLQYSTADCVSWVPRLTLSDFGTNWT